jgi:hypothetical protein
MRRFLLRPQVALPLVISLTALFFALGGAALATGGASSKTRCAVGSVRGIAFVTGGSKGMENIPDSYTGAGSLFGYRYNCAGKGVLVKHAASLPAFDVRFPGNPAAFAVVSASGATPTMSSVQRQPDGAFRVFLATQEENQTVGRRDIQFLVVAF